MTQPGTSTETESQANSWRQRWGLHTPTSLRLRANELGGANYLVEGLLPARSIALVVGDSGLGKSPLMYQLAICIAAGIPFLGHQTCQGRVVIADFENGIGDVVELIERISRYAGLEGPPGEDHLLVWTVNDCQPRYGQLGNALLDILRDVEPSLAIIDSLGSYDPMAEEKNHLANHLIRDFRRLSREHGVATAFVHHRRKESRKAEESAGALEGADLRRWFQDSRGASAFITGSDVRLGAGSPGEGVEIAEAVGQLKEETALVLRGFGRIRGEIGPLYLARAYDEDGEALGYRRLCSVEMLFNSQQQEAFARLGDRFRTGDARRAYRRADQATSDWLNKCLRLGLVRRIGRGQWEKLREGGDGG